MKPTAFDYHAPTTAAEAVGLLAELGDEAKVLAGGQSLIPMLALRLAVFEHLVDVGRIDGLAGIERRNGSAVDRRRHDRGRRRAQRRGGGRRAPAGPGHAAHRPLPDPQPRHAWAARSPTPTRPPSTPRWPWPSTPRWRRSRRAGARTIPAAEFFTGLWSTSLEPDELLAGVSFPVWTGRCGFAVEEFARRHGDFAVAGAVVGVELDADDRVRRCAIGLIGLGVDARCGRPRPRSPSPAPGWPTSTPTSWAGRPWPGSTRCPPTSTARPPTAAGWARPWSPGPGPRPARRHERG